MRSPEGWLLRLEMEAQGQIDPDAIVAHVTRAFTVQPEPSATNPPRCYWCEQVLATPQDAFLDEYLTGVFGYWYCSEGCRNAHVNSKYGEAR